MQRSPRLEAEILLAEALDCARIELYTRFDEVPAPDPIARFREWVKRRATGEPVAYIVGYREFYSLRFEVDSNVLIPRPETEHVVVAALEAAKSIERPTDSRDRRGNRQRLYRHHLGQTSRMIAKLPQPICPPARWRSPEKMRWLMVSTGGFEFWKAICLRRCRREVEPFI